MHPYWISLKGKLGVGITARSEADAMHIFSLVFGAKERVLAITVIKDMRDLDQKHVAPNMGNWFFRGVWFPRGYENSLK